MKIPLFCFFLALLCCPLQAEPPSERLVNRKLTLRGLNVDQPRNLAKTVTVE